MSRHNISSDSRFETEIGYSRAVVQGPWVFVSGCTGYDYSTMTISPDVVKQAEQCMLNIQAALREAGADMKDVVRVRYIVPVREDFEKCWPVLRHWLGDVKPAATMFVAGLHEERMRIEIEVTAYVQGIGDRVGWKEEGGMAEPPA
jgi:enamine deaminase RidA (YjgF/YER057c/UK114 family)